MRIANDLCITAGSMTGTAVINSDPIWVGHGGGACIQAIWTGTATGVLKLQASCDPGQPVPGGQFPAITHWTDVADSSYAVAAAGDYMWNFTVTMMPWLRVVYTNATNTGTLNVQYNTKGF